MADRSAAPVPHRSNPVERFLKRLLMYAIVLGVAFGAGWLWQYSARQLADARAADARIRVPLLEARGFLLESRLDLQATNFGDARKHFEQARRSLEQAIRSNSAPSIRQHLDVSVSETLEAQSRSAQLNPAAAASAASAVAAVNAALDALPPTSAPE